MSLSLRPMEGYSVVAKEKLKIHREKAEVMTRRM